MSLVDRRTFLHKTAGAAVAALAAGELSTFAARTRQTEPHTVFPSTPRKRIAVASYPFRAYIDSPNNRDRDPKLPGMSLEQFAAEVVQKFGVNKIEPHSRQFRSLDADYLAGLRESFHKAGVSVVDIAASVRDSFYDPDAAARRNAVAAARQWVDAAAALASPSARLHISRAKNSAPDVQRCADALREVANYGAEKNVAIVLENDDLVSEDAFFIVKVIEAAKQPYLRALPDFANSMLSGDADFNYRALQVMFEHAYNVCHVKDGEAGDNGKHYNIDMKRSFGILVASGFRGYCSMEFDEPGDPYAATKKLIEQTLQYLR